LEVEPPRLAVARAQLARMEVPDAVEAQESGQGQVVDRLAFIGQRHGSSFGEGMAGTVQLRHHVEEHIGGRHAAAERGQAARREQPAENAGALADDECGREQQCREARFEEVGGFHAGSQSRLAMMLTNTPRPAKEMMSAMTNDGRFQMATDATGCMPLIANQYSMVPMTIASVPSPTRKRPTVRGSNCWATTLTSPPLSPSSTL